MGMTALFEQISPESPQLHPYQEPVDTSFTAVFPDPFSKDTQAVSHNVHRRVWRAYSSGLYDMQFAVAKPVQAEAASFREKIQMYGAEDALIPLTELWREGASEDPYLRFWDRLYSALLAHDRELLPGFLTAMDSVAVVHQDNPQLLANILVSFVQDIPYQLVHELACPFHPGLDSCLTFSCRYHRQGRPCQPNVRFGIYSPVEFMYSLAGDCDTRVVLLKMLFDHYGFDSIVLISRYYQHAMLGLRLPSSGTNFVMVDGLKYYVWETTATGWQMGQLGPTYGNLSYWMPISIP